MQAIQPINDLKVDLTQPVLKEPTARGEFIAQLRAAQQKMFAERPLPRPRQLKFNDCTAAIKYFEDFISQKGLSTIAPAEDLLDEFLNYLLKTNGKHQYCLSLRNKLRNIINNFPPTILNRFLVNNKRKEYLTKNDHLSQKTRDFLDGFRRDGRKLNRKRHNDGNILSGKLLAPRTRETSIRTVPLFLNIVKKNCLLEVTPQDADVFINFYTKQEKRDLALEYLTDLQPIYMNLIGKGLMVENPIKTYNECPPRKVDDDFIMPDQMEILRDLSTVDFKDIFDVRDRMLTFALYYDFCLRNGEASLLNLPDVAWDGQLYGITLEPEIQKGQDKPRVTLYNCFDESRRLIKAYLELRKQYLAGRQVDAFLISKTRTQLRNTGCRLCVQKHCSKLGIKTRKGNTPYPHCLRHTFGTLNIDRLGLCLSPYFIQGRMRHSDLSTTMKIYVQNNPLLAKLNHIASVQVGMARNNHLPSYGSAEEIGATIDSKPNDISMPEAEAVKALRSYGISSKALRIYAETKGMMERKNKQVFYSRTFIQDLAQNWLTKQQVMKKLGFGSSRFYVWKKARGINPIVIGKVSLVKATDVIEELKK